MGCGKRRTSRRIQPMDWNMPNSSRKAERRRHDRQPITGKLRVLWHDAEGREQVCAAEVVDISVNGLRMRVDIKMAPQTYVTVNDRDIGITGRGSVRYCRYEKGKYVVGLEFAGGTGWKPRA